jgi:hypothetical protein
LGEYDPYEGMDDIDISCAAYQNSLNEEIFFFLYNFYLTEDQSMAMTPYKRKWLLQRFIEQKKKENQEIEKAKAKAKSKK